MTPAARPRGLSALFFSLSFALLWLGVFMLPLEAQEQLVYRPERIRAGAFWTLLSTHAVHQSFVHLGLNLVTWAVVCWFLAPAIRSWSRTFVSTLMIAVAATVLAHVLWPEPRGVVGSSALIYGLLAYGSLLGALRGPRRFGYGLALLALTLKIIIEHLQGGSFWDVGLDSSGRGVGGERSPIAFRLHTAGFGCALLAGALVNVKDRLVP